MRLVANIFLGARVVPPTFVIDLEMETISDESPKTKVRMTQMQLLEESDSDNCQVPISQNSCETLKTMLSLSVMAQLEGFEKLLLPWALVVPEEERVLSRV